MDEKIKRMEERQPEIYPVGMTFTGDMKHMQVFYGLYGYGATHIIVSRYDSNYCTYYSL